MAEIKLVTQNDEPALALGEYLLSEDGETLYVGSAGVADKDSETIYIGRSPIQIKSGVLSRLAVYDIAVATNPISANVGGTFNRVIQTHGVIINSETNNISIDLMEVE